MRKRGGVVDIMADDIRLAASREPPEVSQVKVKFNADYDPDSEHAKRQRLFFVRTFEAGPERALVGNNGDGRYNDMAFHPPDANAPEEPPAGSIDNASFTGLKTGDFKALGGLAMVAYFVKDQTLYRAIRSPVDGPLSTLATEASAQPIATDVLYLSFDYWSQQTKSWDEPVGRDKDKNDGPQKIWDSTRGLDIPPLNGFFLHRGSESLNDPTDDVFPRKVRITVCVDSTMPRCLYTKLVTSIGESDTTIEVDDTRGFPDGDDEDSYILIDEEWMHYTKRGDGIFEIDKRGARGTHFREHSKDAVVRTGKTFQRVIYIPSWREDFTPDDVYYTRKHARVQLPRTIVK